MDGRLALFAGAAFVGVLLAGAVALDSRADEPGPADTASTGASVPLDSVPVLASNQSWPDDDDHDDHYEDRRHEDDDDDHDDDDRRVGARHDEDDDD